MSPQTPALPSESGRDAPLVTRAILVVFFLYLFLVGISFLETGIGALGSGFQEGLLASVSHPLSGLCAGLLGTVLVQSSSVTTSAIVGMVGAGTLPLELAIPMVMGANIGTTVTSTLAALGSIRRSEEFRRAFAAATMHDFFNIIGVAVLLPLELTTGLLRRMAVALTEIFRGREFNYAEPGSSPIRVVVNAPSEWLSGLITPTPATAVVYLVLSLAFIFLALALITKNMRQIVAGSVERAMNRMIGAGGGVMGIVVGIAVTVAVQSSSITTSILVPLVASGVLALHSAYPITLGANIGTTVTAIIASLAVALPEGLTIAFVHLLFNCMAVLLLYPVPRLRMIPIQLAEGLASLTVKRPQVVLIWVLTVFIVLPLIGLFLLQ